MATHIHTHTIACAFEQSMVVPIKATAKREKIIMFISNVKREECDNKWIEWWVAINFSLLCTFIELLHFIAAFCCMSTHYSYCRHCCRCLQLETVKKGYKQQAHSHKKPRTQNRIPSGIEEKVLPQRAGQRLEWRIRKRKESRVAEINHRDKQRYTITTTVLSNGRPFTANKNQSIYGRKACCTN